MDPLYRSMERLRRIQADRLPQIVDPMPFGAFDADPAPSVTPAPVVAEPAPVEERPQTGARMPFGVFEPNMTGPIAPVEASPQIVEPMPFGAFGPDPTPPLSQPIAPTPVVAEAPRPSFQSRIEQSIAEGQTTRARMDLRRARELNAISYEEARRYSDLLKGQEIEASNYREARPLQPGESLDLGDGAHATERTIGVNDPRLNRGRPTNIPTIWNVDGQVRQLNHEQSLKLAIESGLLFPAFDDFEQAGQAAQERSDRGGAAQGSIGTTPGLARNPFDVQRGAPRPEFIAVNIPKEGEIRFPGTMSDEQIGVAIRETFPDLDQGFFNAAGSAFAAGAIGATGTVGQGIAGQQTFLAQREQGQFDMRDLLMQGLEALRQEPDPAQKQAMYQELVRRSRDAFGASAFTGYYSNELRRALQGEQGIQDTYEPPQLLDPNVATEDRFAYQAGDALQDYADETFPVMPENAENYFVQIAGGAGSTIPLFAAAIVHPALGAATAIEMGAGEATQRAVNARATESEIGLAAVLGVAPGATEYAPIAYLLNVVSKMHPAGTSAKSFISNMAQRAVKQGLIEGTTEGVQQFMQNSIASLVYNPDQELWQDVPENMKVGFGVGMLFGLPGGTAGAYQDRRQAQIQEALQAQTPEETEAEKVEALRAAVEGAPTPPTQAAQAEQAGAEAETDYAKGRADYEKAAKEATREQLTAQGVPDMGTSVEVTFPDGGIEQLVVGDIFVGRDGKPSLTLVDSEGQLVHQGAHEDLQIREIKGDGTQAAPAVVETGTDADRAAAQAVEPTPAQAEAGNYKKGHMKFASFDITIENARGSQRKGIGPGGVEWSVDMPAHYGYVKRSEAADGEELDVYIGQEPESDRVFIVDQIDLESRDFDEHKVILGTRTMEEAEDLYRAGFSDGRGGARMGGVTEMSMAEFEEYVQNGNLKKALVYEKPQPEPEAAAQPDLKPEPVRQPEAPAPDAREAIPVSADTRDDFAAKLAAGEVVGKPGAAFQVVQSGDGWVWKRTSGKYLVTNAPDGGREVWGKDEAIRRAADWRFGEPAAESEAAKPEINPADPLDLAGNYTAHFADGGDFKTIVQARKHAKTAGYTLTDKEVDEAVEAGVTAAAREIVTGAAPAAAYDQLVDLYRRQPPLNTRTSQSASQQAYSTPAPLAFIAAQQAGITPETTVYEPTAGQGALLLTADPAKVLANELDSGRQNTLRAMSFKVTGRNALQMPTEQKFDSVIMNPPFGTDPSGKQTKYPIWRGQTGKIDQAIVARALENMKDDGSAVLLIGGQKQEKGYRSRGSLAFFKQLYDKYQVVDHFTADGSLYSRQGAAWPIDVIVIKGRGRSKLPLPSAVTPRLYKSWDAFKELVDGQNQRPADKTGEILDPGQRSAVRDAEGRPAPVDRQPDGVPGTSGPARPRADQPSAGERSALPGPDGRRHALHPERARQGELGGSAVPRERPVSGQDGGRAGRGAAAGENVSREAPARTEGADAGELAGGTGGRPSLVEELADDAAFEKALAAAVGPAPKEAPKAQTLEEADEALLKAFRDAMPDEKFSLGNYDASIYARVRDSITQNIKTAITAGKTLQEALVRVIELLHKGLKMTQHAASSYVRAWRKDWQAGKVQIETQEVVKADLPGTVARPAVRPEEAETDFQVSYAPRSKTSSIGTLVPKNMQNAITRTLDKIEEAVGDIDVYVASQLDYKDEAALLNSGHFSAEQIDALAMSIYNAERKAGVIIADQTGVGKGRVAAGMMKWARLHNMTPVFFTRDAGLFGDMYRDLYSIGERNINPFFTDANLKGKNAVPIEEEFGGGEMKSDTPAVYKKTVNEVIDEGTLPDRYTHVFTTYSQVQPTGRFEERRKFLEALAPNAYIALDESHMAGGQGATDARYKSKTAATGRAEWIRTLLPDAAGANYFSATYAKSPAVMDLYMWTDMVQAVDKPEDLAEAIAVGGVPLQQVVATMLVDAGQYVRRERSYDGIEFRREVVPVDMVAANTVSKLMRQMYIVDRRMDYVRGKFIEQLNKAGEAGLIDNSVGDIGASSVNFSALMHNISSQALLAMKLDSSIEQVAQSVERGESVVVALSNTMGAFLDNYMAENGLTVGDSLQDFSFNEVFKRYHVKSRSITAVDPVDAKKKRQILMTDEDIISLGSHELLREYKRIGQSIASADLSALSPAPIDKMIFELKKRGIRVGEVTGRQMTIDYAQGAEAQRRDAGKKSRKKAVIDFQDNKLDVLIINESGSTGLSMHAQPTKSVNAENVRPRSMTVLQPHPNIDVFMQILGRIHRTGQVKNPRFNVALADLPAETRPAAVLSKKMASLNANTTADRDSAVSDKEAIDFLNPVGEAVIRRLYADDVELQDILGVTLDPNADVGPKITGRLVILPVKEQAEFYERLEIEYKAEIERLDAIDENPLVAKTLELDAITESAVEITTPRDGDSLFAQPAVLERIDAKVLRKPPKASDVWARVQEAVKAPDQNRIRPMAMREIADVVDKLREGLTEFSAELRKQIAAVDEQLKDANAALKAAPDAGAKADLSKAVEKLDKKRGTLAKKLEQASGRVQKASDKLNRVPAGSGIFFATKNQKVYGRVISVKYRKTSKDPTALSNVQIRLILADGTPSLDVPLSQISVSSDGYALERADRDIEGKTIDTLFEEGRLKAREPRYVVTGNLLAGYAKYKDEAQGIINFSNRAGQIRQGILMPRKFDPKKFEAKQPVAFKTGEQVREFLTKSEEIVKSDDGVVQFSSTDRGRIMFAVQTRGGKLIENNRDVRAILSRAGHSAGLTGRKGSKTRQVSLSPEQASEMANLMMELGVRLESSSNRDLALKVTGQADLSADLGGAVQGDQYSVTQGFIDKSDNIRERIIAIAKQINPNANVRFVNQLFGRGKALQDSGAKTTERMEVAGSYSALHQLVTVSLSNRYSQIDTAFHELWHSLEQMLTPQEQAVLRKAYPDSAGIVHEERVAIAFAKWARNEATQQDSRIKKIFAKLRRFFQRVKSVLTGQGFDRVEKIFKDARSGEIASRLPENNNPTIGELESDMQQDIVKALGELGYDEQTALGLSIDEARYRMRDQVRYAVGSPGQKKSKRVHGTPIQEKIMQRLTVMDEDKPLWRAMRDWIVEKAHELDLEWRQGIFDFADSVLRYDDKARTAYRATLRTQNLAGVMIAVLKSGPLRFNAAQDAFEIRPDYHGHKGGFETIFTEIADKGLMPKWKAWAIAVRANRLNREGKENLMGNIAVELKMTKGVDKDGNPIPDTQRAIDELLKMGGDPMDPNYKGTPEHPEFIPAFKHYQAFNKGMLDMAEQAGVINAIQRAAWEKSDYIPFYRVLEEESQLKTPGKRTRGIEGQRAPIRKLTGGESIIGDVVENMVLNMTYLVDASFKNNAMQRITPLAEQSGAMEKVGNVEAKKALIPAEAAAKALRNIGVNIDALTPAERRQVLATFQLVPPTDPDVVSVMVDGQAQYYRVTDPLLLRTLTGLNHKTIGMWMNLMSGAKNLLTTAVTVDPTFMLRNLIRDSVSTKVVTGADTKFGAAILKGVKDAYKFDQDLLDIYAAGAGTGGFYKTAGADVRRHIEARLSHGSTVLSIGGAARYTKAGIKTAWEQWQRVGFAAENANRLAVYRAMRKKGMTIAEAAHEAQDVLNFSMHGDWALIQSMIAVLPFFNARLQGLYRLGRAFHGGRDNETVSLFGFDTGAKAVQRYQIPGSRRHITINYATLLRGMILVGMSLAYWGMMHDDERWQELNDWERDLYYVFWIGDQKIYIPKGFEVGALFSTMPERMMDALAHGQYEEFANGIGRMFRDTFAFNPVPQLIRPIFEQVANHQYFYDRPIESMSDKNVVPELRHDARTSETAILLADAMPDALPEAMRSPKRLEHLVRGYTGTLGMFLLGIVDQGARPALNLGPEAARRGPTDFPIVRSFLPPGVQGTKWMQQFYELKSETNQLHGSMKRLERLQNVEDLAAFQEENQNKLRFNKRLNKMGKELSKLRARGVQINASKSMTDTEKRQALDEIRERQNAIVKRVEKIFEAIKVSEEN